MKQIRYSIVPTSLGRLLVAATTRGVCAVSLADSDTELLHFLHSEFPDAEIAHDEKGLRPWAETVRQLAEGSKTIGVPTDVAATEFQVRVWRELKRIPFGKTRSYREVAATLGMPAAPRAVARACATNPLALLIPCHRVVAANGELSGYRWGIQRKRALLERERRAGSRKRRG